MMSDQYYNTKNSNAISNCIYESPVINELLHRICMNESIGLAEIESIGLAEIITHSVAVM